ncbi:DUF6046 domain-containing protein [Mucilaginibacter rubeus]|uniref:DUF6046 domain-containing protein n=1 Tax=Mucilaginibacter rubeus TaxID=2027860 RepID=A0A5C1I6C6_9SPHI|nr:DUF6046 domain-containing protein [Mucilaginibacter rubeus]QEM13483.1 hypothetical protein DEO27_026885 [Mucilaginibacter rubeus]
MAIATLNTAFDLKELFEQVHGYKPAKIAGLPDTIQPAELPQIGANARKTTNLYGQALYGAADTLGYEVFCPVTIEVDGVDYVFPYTVVGIRRAKTIVEEFMTELDGDINEIVGNRPYEITIKGFLIGINNQFPDDQIKMLNDVFVYNKPVRLKSAYTDIFLHDSDYVLIKDMQLPEKPKVIGVRDFTLAMKSDTIFTLYVD